MLRVLSVATKVDADAILVGFYPRVVTWRAENRRSPV
jgi:hypothetical protein